MPVLILLAVNLFAVLHAGTSESDTSLQKTQQRPRYSRNNCFIGLEDVQSEQKFQDCIFVLNGNRDFFFIIILKQTNTKKNDNFRSHGQG